MRKWTKGFLIFGVVTTIIGFILLFVGIQSDGIKSLLAMSKEPVYDSRTEELTFGKEVENLEITLHQHALTITDSFDDQIHISYHPSISANHDLITSQNDKTLSLTDKKLSETPFLSSGIGGILHIASSYSSRFNELILQVPKGSTSQQIAVKPVSLMLVLKMRPSIQTAISSELKEVVSKTVNSQPLISLISLTQTLQIVS